MIFGSILADAGACTLQTSDNMRVVLNKTSFHRFALRVIGIPHIGHRIRARTIFSYLAQGKGTLLDAGCGDGIYALHCARLGFETTGIDNDEQKLQTGRLISDRIGLPVRFERADLCALPFANETFDAILCTEVLEHINEDEKALSELSRVLKSGGKVVITFPADSPLSREIQHALGHVRPGYSLEQACAMFGRCGLEIDQQTSALYFLGQVAWKANRDLFSRKALCATTFYPLYALALLDSARFARHGKPLNHLFLLRKTS